MPMAYFRLVVQPPTTDLAFEADREHAQARPGDKAQQR